jgi:hypothetical protein
MSDVTVLKCWPACVDAIDWSPDGIIALASDERVELLVRYPRSIQLTYPTDVLSSSQTQLTTREIKMLHNGSMCLLGYLCFPSTISH